MSSKTFTALTKIRVGGKIGTQKEWKELVASKLGLTVEEVGIAVKSAGLDDFQLPADMDREKAKLLGKVVKAAKEDIKAAAELQKAENDRRAAEVEALKKQKEEMALAFVAQKETAVAVANDFAGNLNHVISAAVEDYFVIDEGGNFVLKDEDNAKESFAAGFATLKEMFDKTKQLGGGFALYEAKLALAAEEKFGAQWPNFFASTNDGDVMRISRNMKALKVFNSFGISTDSIPMGVLIVLTEVRYDIDDKEINEKIKKQVIEKYIADSKAAGRFLNQKEAQQIINQSTEKKRANAAQKWNYLYIYSDGSVRGSSEYDEHVDCVLVIDKNQRIVSKDAKSKTFAYRAIPSLTGKEADKDAADIAKSVTPDPEIAGLSKKRAAKKAAKKPAEATVVAEEPAPAPEPAPKAEAPSNVIPITAESDDDGIGSLEDLLG